MRKRILVTGGAGFIGSHLCERLLNTNYEVVCLDNFFTSRRMNIEHLLGDQKFEIVRHDITQPIIIEVDEIYHLACPASPIHYQRNPVRTIKTAVHGTLNMLEMAREVHAKILVASTSEVYGNPQEHPQRESYWGNANPIGPRACYDEGKRCAEALCVSYAQQYDVDTRIARIFNTYGPRMHENDGRVVSNFMVQALDNQPITINGDGKQTRSFCYVQDMVDALILLMNKETDSGPFNLGNPVELTILQLANKIIELTGSSSAIHYEPLPINDPVRRRPDIGKAKEELGWEPKISIEDGLRRTIKYFKSVLHLVP